MWILTHHLTGEPVKSGQLFSDPLAVAADTMLCCDNVQKLLDAKEYLERERGIEVHPVLLSEWENNK